LKGQSLMMSSRAVDGVDYISCNLTVMICHRSRLLNSLDLGTADLGLV